MFLGDEHLGETMEEDSIAELMDQHRWLLNNGLVSDNVKNQLFFYGSIVHRNVQAVELDIHAEDKLVKYKIYVDKALLKDMDLYKELSKSTSLFGMWRFRRLLRKHGSLDFQMLLGKFVKDYCGPMWNATATVVDFDTYIEEIGVEGENGTGSQQSNQLLDK
jgi:hypothetical protein